MTPLGGSGDGNLYTIDKATGTATAVGPSGLTDLSGLAAVPAGAQPVPGIPALGSLGILLVAGILAAAGLILLKLRA